MTQISKNQNQIKPNNALKIFYKDNNKKTDSKNEKKKNK